VTSLLLLAAAQLSFQTGKVQGRQAYILENSVIRVAALRGGGHLAEIRFVSADARKSLNPMRVPHYPTIEPYQYNPKAHDALYGDSSHRWLSSGYMGHLLCFPAFGPPSSPEEIAAQLGNHGEAPIVEWKQTRDALVTPGAVTLWYGADLPKTRYRVDRTVTLRAGEAVVRVEESVENLLPFDRPINWVQHATFGEPFAEPGKNFLDVSAVKGEGGGGRANNSLASGAIVWPEGTARDGSKVSLRPFQPAERAGTYYALLLNPARPISYFTAYHSDYLVLIGYLFPTADNPWIGDWQENRSNTGKPWDGKAVARGLEFGTTPFPEGLRKSVERGSLYGVPTYRWIGGRQRLTTTFTVFLAEIPAGFAGVQDVREEAGRIRVVERSTGRTITATGGAAATERPSK